MTANGAVTQTYTYTIQASGTAQPLTLMPGNPVANVIANGQEVQYTFLYSTSGGARPSPQDIGDCELDTEAVRIRIVQLTANTATLGFTAAPGSLAKAFDWWCDDGGGGGSGGSGPGGTADPTPNIDSVSPVPLIAGVPTTITITGENFGKSEGSLLWGGTAGCSQTGDDHWASTGTIDTITVNVVASNPGYCTVAIDATSDDYGNSFASGGGSSPESSEYLIPVTSVEPPAPSVSIFMPCTANCNIGDRGADVTNGAATVVIGEQVTLNSLLTGASATSQNQNWTIPGAVGGYNADVNSGKTFDPKPNYLNNTQSAVQFYFAAPTAAGSPAVVTYTATVPRCPAACAATVKFTVLGPAGATAGSVPSITTTAQGQDGIVLSGDPGLQQVQYGSSPPSGIRFQTALTDPTGYGPGSVSWIQVSSINDTRVFATGGAQKSVCSGLDTDRSKAFPYGTGQSASDSPLEPLMVRYSSQSDADSFTMWLMYGPALPNAISVPVASVSWNWGFQASSSDGGQTWTVTSKTSALVNGQQPQSQPTSTFPTWSAPAIPKTGTCAYQ
jgi:hypothetical protein